MMWFADNMDINMLEQLESIAIELFEQHNSNQMFVNLEMCRE